MDNFYNDFGLFKFSIIAPIINKTHNYRSINEYIGIVASKNYEFKGKIYKFSKSGIKNRYLYYKKNGLSIRNWRRN